MAEPGRAVLMSSHITSDLERIADRIVCIDAGASSLTCPRTSSPTRWASRAAAWRTSRRSADAGVVPDAELRYLRHDYGIDVLVPDRFAFAENFPEIPVDRMTIDDYMTLTPEGRCPIMKRAFFLEMTIFRDYARQLVGLGILVSLCIGLGMQTPLAMPATLTCMFFMMSAMGLAAYDQLNHWELFRLTLPLSRRDVVLGRYAAIVTFGLLGMVVGISGALICTVVASAIGLPGEVGEAFAFDPDMLSVMAVVTCFTLLIGSVVASIVTPLYFRLGQTRATQILPTVIVLLFVVPVAIFGNSGMLDGGIPGMELVSAALEALETPAGMAVGLRGSRGPVGCGAGISAVVSLKLYERREL